MLIFFDAEMTDLCADRKLISIGFVSEDGRELYVELSDTYQLTDCSDFVRESVLPNLQGGDARMTMRDLSVRFIKWIISFEERVQLATDSIQWDWPWIEAIYAEAGAFMLENSVVWDAMKDSPGRLAGVARPANTGDGKPFSLLQTEAFNLVVAKAFESGLRRHHALDDAKANRCAWLATKGE